MYAYLPYSPSIMIPCTFWIFHSPWFLQTASFQTGSLLFHASTKNFKLFSCSCNKNANSCINLMNGWKESCSVKENKAKISQSHNQFIYESLWCITLYHTRCVFFSGHGHFQKTLKKLPHTNLVCGSLLISVFFHIHLLFHSRDQHFLCRNCLVGK